MFLKRGEAININSQNVNQILVLYSLKKIEPSQDTLPDVWLLHYLSEIEEKIGDQEPKGAIGHDGKSFKTRNVFLVGDANLPLNLYI